ncbi:AraC family transcriptional regulator [Saccharibacillus sp. CPCC 101409]|uniref:AraC family transcriptional regulator n=1 Tax=Saccharibacillus sp. CPCC 101409 TaxID=3058041 RepID=UPI002671E22D|nr:AraC family transcriptional regulator [Saccharibacillus sp. CPCC 101409]MDO3411760.1 AraC family transcriptional regulator [Saccharibacillus sp. CPCC 101409]
MDTEFYAQDGRNGRGSGALPEALRCHLLASERVELCGGDRLAYSPVYRLLFASAGSLRVDVGDGPLTLQAGEVLLLPPGSAAEIGAAGEASRHGTPGESMPESGMPKQSAPGQNVPARNPSECGAQRPAAPRQSAPPDARRAADTGRAAGPLPQGPAPAPPCPAPAGGGKAVYCRFDFTAADLTEPEPARYAGELPGFAGGLAAASPEASALAEELHALRFARTDATRRRRQAGFERLLGLLAASEEPASVPSEAARAVADGIAALERRFAEDWTAARLAEAAGLTPRRYAAVFRAITGMAPLEYLNALRIERAGQMLRRGDGPLREIASRTGFRDEYYFSRRFRAATGSAPGRYARRGEGMLTVRDSLHRRVSVPAKPRRVLYVGEAVGDLLALGIQPVGGHCMPAQSGFCGERLGGFIELSSDDDLRGAARIHPDLIVCTSMDERTSRLWSKIAPVLVHDSWSPLGERIRLLGRWFGRERQAERWLERYFEAEQGMWRGLGGGSGSGGVRETASVFLFERGRFFVMGKIGLSSMLYHPDGLRPAEPVRSMLIRDEGYMEISPEAASVYAADRIFMLMSSSQPDRRAADDFMRGPHWKKLSKAAVRGVHVVESSRWNAFDAYSRSRLLGDLPALLNGR